MDAPQKQRIAVAGATGRVGRHIADVLTERGHEVVPIARSRGVDVITGEGLAGALAGVDVIVDAATGPSPEEGPASEFFTTAARNLSEAGAAAGATRMVIVSIIGTDRFAGGYGAAKVAHEKAAEAGPLPVHVVRAAQFHEFVEQLVDWGTQGDVAYVGRMRTQAVAARSVAEVLADVATAPSLPAGPYTEVAGPQPEDLVELARLLVARRGHPARVEGVGDPDDADQVMSESGGLLPSPDAILAGPTFREWLDAS